MKLVESLSDIIESDLGITIGNFDGVHVGHQMMLNSIKESCVNDGLSFTVVTFLPHPLQILAPRDGHLINTYEERRDLLSSLKVDNLVELPFNRDFSTLSPTDFFDEHVFKSGKVKKIFLGHDFAFGENKSGDHNFVKAYCIDKNIEFVFMEEFNCSDMKVSSSVIRKNILESNISDTSKMLGRDFFVKGKIVKGAGRGKQIGFPTANLDLVKERIVPSKGVYFTKTQCLGASYNSITNIGVNPTFKDDQSLCVETHILDFDQDIYGEDLTVSFIKKIRDEKRFSSVEELINQISCDVNSAKEYFN